MAKEIEYKIILNHSKYLSNLNSLLYITADVISLKQSKIKYYEDELEKLVKEDFSNFDEIYIKYEKEFRENLIYNQDFNYLFFNSIFINFFSLFEIYLASLGKLCENISDFKITIKDINGNGTVDSYRKYFHLVMKIESASNDNVLWKDLMEFKEIRNAIVHNENRLNKNKSANTNSVKGLKKLKEHNIPCRGAEMSFKIDNIDFLNDFKDLCKRYTETITKEILKNYC